MKNPFWTLLLLAIPALPVHPACPAKITVKECPEYASATDNTYLKVRIVLDGASEVLVPKGQKSSLRIWTEDMLAKYDLRAWSNPDSAYKTRYNEGDFNPAYDQVMYHNAAIRKSNLALLIAEPYLFAIEQACSPAVSTDLCTEMNAKEDTAKTLSLLILTEAIYSDTTALKAYYSKYDFRSCLDPKVKVDPSDMIKSPYTGVFATIAILKAASLDPEVRFMEQWAIPRPATLSAKTHKHSPPRTRKAGFNNRMVNGKAIPLQAR